ncbi:hypothetical protein [Salibacterium sp. K-3]
MKMFLFLFLCLFIIPSGTVTAGPMFEEGKRADYEPPKNHFKSLGGSLAVLHILDNDEYMLESSGSLETNSPAGEQQIHMILFEDGYVKDSVDAWSEQESLLTASRQTPSEDSGRYDLTGFYYMKKAPVYSYDWSSSTLYVLDTPMTELHSFSRPDSKEEKKAGKMIDAIIRQQQQHVKRLIKDKGGLPESSLVFPLMDWEKYMARQVSSLDPDTLEKAWRDIYHSVLKETESHKKQQKKIMPFLSWDKQKQKLSLFIHYSSP